MSGLHEYDDNDLMKAFEICASNAEKESDRTWQRFSLLLSIHTGLMAVAALVAQNTNFTWTIIIISISGILLSDMWIQIIKVSKYYEERWIQDCRLIISNHPLLRRYVNARGIETDVLRRPTRRAASGYARRLAKGAGFIWAVLLVVTTIDLCGRYSGVVMGLFVIWYVAYRAWGPAQNRVNRVYRYLKFCFRIKKRRPHNFVQGIIVCLIGSSN